MVAETIVDGTEAPAEGAPPADTGAERPTESQEQEPTEAAGKAESPPFRREELQAGFTRKSMALGEIRTVLGLERGTPDEEIVAALKERMAPRSPAAPESDDPVLREGYERLRAQQEAIAIATYGEQIVGAASQIRDVALSTDDLGEISAILWERAGKPGATPPPSAQPPAAPAAEQAEESRQEPPEAPEIGDSDRNTLDEKPTIGQDVISDLKGSGKTRQAGKFIASLRRRR